MSKFSFPDVMRPDAVMDGWMKEMRAMPVPPLMIHPMAASAAATALGVAAAGQMLGMMMGSMQGAIDASRRMGLPSAEQLFDGAAAWSAEGWAAKPAKPAPRLKAVRPSRPAPAPDAPAREPAPKAAKPEPEASTRSTGTVSDLKAVADTAAHAVLETGELPAAAPKPQAKGELAPEDFRQPAEIARPETPDDLKQISGIGPKLEQVLNGLGIWTFGQIVEWTPEEVAWLDDYLQFKGRIERDTWQAQAKTLAGSRN